MKRTLILSLALLTPVTFINAEISKAFNLPICGALLFAAENLNSTNKGKRVVANTIWTAGSATASVWLLQNFLATPLVGNSTTMDAILHLGKLFGSPLLAAYACNNAAKVVDDLIS